MQFISRGGASSFAAAQRVVERYGTDETVLLTADTRSEAERRRQWTISQRRPNEHMPRIDEP